MIQTIQTTPGSYAPPAAVTQQASDIGPLAPAERMPLVDVLRGIAILGVLVAYAMWNLGTPPAETWTAAERILDKTLGILVDAKFVTMFAFLFGAGTAQQWRRIESIGENPVAIHMRRMLFLLAAGAVHAVLLRNGDILANYAILGMMLIAVRRWPTRRIVVAAVVLAILPYVAFVTLRVLHWKLATRPAAVPDVSWRHYWADNLAWLRYKYLTEPFLSWPRILAVMLVGVLADRGRFLTRIAGDRRLALRTLSVALPVAVVSRAAVSVVAGWWNTRHAPLARGIVLDQTYWISAWSLAATYIAGFALLLQRPAWPARLGWLRGVGRMAFTNYLLQAAILVPVCLAFGLFDAVTPTRGILLALGVSAVQV
ncbi:MAG TPA: DUF418 domain-containing protein, partial [Gemmatimonadaceae bacterium]|nr:DUF418 domain-containing protein [Gemmatimonadaceae bacterium]